MTPTFVQAQPAIKSTLKTADKSAMEQLLKKPTVRILLADDETLLSQRLVEYLNSKGFETRAVRSGAEVKELLDTWRPTFVLYDLMLPDLNALEFLRHVNSDRRVGEGKMKVIVISGHNNPANVRECMRLGAADFIAKPIGQPELLARLILHMQAKREVLDPHAVSEDERQSGQYFMHLCDLTMREVLKGDPTEECLHKLTGLTGLSLKAARTSVIRADNANRKGFVIASSDKRNINGLTIDLVKYPEVLYVLNNEKLLAVDNLAADPTLFFVTKQHKEVQFNAMIVAPIKIKNEVWGVLSIRLADHKQRSTEFEIRYAQLVAHIAGMAIAADPFLMLPLAPAA